MWICIFCPYSSRERRVRAYGIFCVRLLQVCSFNSTGQFQSLRLWNEQRVRLSRFFFNNQSNAKEVSPTATSKQMIRCCISGIRNIALIALLLLSITGISCSSSKTIAFSCQERQIEIYVDDEYLGRDLVYYTIPKGREYVEVSCRENGIEVYHRRISVEGRKGTLIELQIPKNYRYSTKPY